VWLIIIIATADLEQTRSLGW